MSNDKSYTPGFNKHVGKSVGKTVTLNAKFGNGHARDDRRRESYEEPSSSSASSENERIRVRRRCVNENSHPIPVKDTAVTARFFQKANGETRQELNVGSGMVSRTTLDKKVLDKLKNDNRELKERLEKDEDDIIGILQSELQLERDKCKSLETKLQEAQERIDELNKEQESLIDIFSEERDRRDIEEENLRKRLKDASNLIDGLRGRVRLLESRKPPSGKR